MKVKAKALGYYGLKKRKEGEVFEIEGEKHFSKVWMEKVGGQSVEPTKGLKKPKEDLKAKDASSSDEVL